MSIRLRQDYLPGYSEDFLSYRHLIHMSNAVRMRIPSEPLPPPVKEPPPDAPENPYVPVREPDPDEPTQI